MRKELLLTATLLLSATTIVHADVFEYNGLVIAGDDENTYVHDPSKTEEATDKIFYYPPGKNFCVYQNSIYFDADDQLVKYTPDTGDDVERLGSVGGGFTVKTSFAGILEDRLYFTVSEGYSEDEYNLKYLDLKTDEIHDCLTGIADACVWKDTLYAVMEVEHPDDPENKHFHFGPLSEDLSSITNYSQAAVVPQEIGTDILYATEDAVFYQEYILDEETGEPSCVCLRKMAPNPADGHLEAVSMGTVDDPAAELEFLGETAGNLFIRIRHPENETENAVACLNLSTGEIYDSVFTGNSSDTFDSDMIFSDDAAYYMAEDNSLWQYSFVLDAEDSLIGTFPPDAVIQGITKSDVYYKFGADLYAVSLEDLKNKVPESTQEGTDPQILLEEIEEAIGKSISASQPVPHVWPEILKTNPDMETWIGSAKGKELHAAVSLSMPADEDDSAEESGAAQETESAPPFTLSIDGTFAPDLEAASVDAVFPYESSDVKLSVRKEGSSLTLKAEADGSEMEYPFTLPENLFSGETSDGTLLPEEYGLSYLLEGAPVTVEEGSCEHGGTWSEEEHTFIKTEVPCRIYHTQISWKKIDEIVRTVMVKISDMASAFSVDTGTLNPDVISEMIARISEYTGGGVDLDFYITDEGCIKVMLSVLQKPGVTGAMGGKPEMKRIAKYDTTRGIKWTVSLEQNPDPGPFSSERERVSSTVSKIITETSSGDYPDIETASLSFEQYLYMGAFYDYLSLTYSSGSGVHPSFSFSFLPEKNTGVLSASEWPRHNDMISVYVENPVVSGNLLQIPLKVLGKVFGSTVRLEGELTLEYR